MAIPLPRNKQTRSRDNQKYAPRGLNEKPASEMETFPYVFTRLSSPTSEHFESKTYQRNESSPQTSRSGNKRANKTAFNGSDMVAKLKTRTSSGLKDKQEKSGGHKGNSETGEATCTGTQKAENIGSSP
ncbi:MAG: hypothetical protein M1830_003189 [Pleopsidium flavum]|nr:MAG: hypothetical protein M1830_003189 [Pleopsidium flavum]